MQTTVSGQFEEDYKINIIFNKTLHATGLRPWRDNSLEFLLVLLDLLTICHYRKTRETYNGILMKTDFL